MSNIASTAMQKTAKTPKAGPMGVRERRFTRGTEDLLTEARNLVENATQQGQELNPMIYRMLGMEPVVEDYSADLGAAQQELDAAQSQLTQAEAAMAQLKGIPKGKRTPAQRKQFRQLKKQIPGMQRALETAQHTHGRVSTMPKRITGFTRLAAEHIPSESPFSAENPLYQIQRTEAERAQQAMAGGIAVDPTLVHQYDQAESKLRAQLAARYGPDYENSSVGQLALQNFARQKNEAYATWNFNAAQQYANQAFSQAGAQQTLLSNLIGMYREPGNWETTQGGALSNLAQQRLAQQQAELNERMARAGMQTTTQTTAMGPLLGAAASGAGALLTTPYNKQGDTLASRGVQGAGALWDWATGGGANAAAAANAAASPAYNAGVASAGATGGTVAGAAGAGMSAEGVGAGMSSLL